MIFWEGSDQTSTVVTLYPIEEHSGPHSVPHGQKISVGTYPAAILVHYAYAPNNRDLRRFIAVVPAGAISANRAFVPTVVGSFYEQNRARGSLDVSAQVIIIAAFVYGPG